MFIVRVASAVLLFGVLNNCASPYFIDDPQTLLIGPKEVPNLIKSLRCEMATYVAANNRRTILFVAEAKSNGTTSAITKYPYFALDTGSFGGVALDLKLQDTASLGAGTQFDWKRIYNLTHSKAWNIGPTAGDQSTYDAAWGFIVPQDIYLLDEQVPKVLTVADSDGSDQTEKFECYKAIPKLKNPPFQSAYTSQDLENLAAGSYPELENFTRMRVKGITPLAKWLQDVSTEIGKTTFLTSNSNEREAIHPAQMTYTFTIQVSAGLDVKYAAATSLWPTVGVEASGGIQHTSTLTIVLNGIEAQLASGVKGGNAKNDEANPLPKIKVEEKGIRGAPTVQYKLPKYVGRTQSRGHLTYPNTLIPLEIPSQ